MGSFPMRRSPVGQLVPADQDLRHMQVSILLRGVDGTVSQAYVQRKLGNVTQGSEPRRAATATAPWALVRPSPHRSHRCGGSFMSRSFFKLPIKLRALAAVGCMAAILAPAACSSGSSGSNAPGVVTVAVVANPLITGQMVPLTKSVFQKQYPGIKVKFVTYTEGDLRAAIERDVSTHSNAFNVIMIGPYETPLFAKNGWLGKMTKQFFPKSPRHAPGDLLPRIAQSLSYNGGEYAVPFYGESSMLYYRTDLFAKAHLTMPVHPTWAQVQSFAAKLNQPGKLAGVCLRGLAGWGDNMASLDTVVNTFGGEWFNNK